MGRKIEENPVTSEILHNYPTEAIIKYKEMQEIVFGMINEAKQH